MKLSREARRLACELAGQVYAELRSQDAVQVQYNLQSRDGADVTIVVSVGRGAQHLNQHCESLRVLGITAPIEPTIDVTPVIGDQL